MFDGHLVELALQQIRINIPWPIEKFGILLVFMSLELLPGLWSIHRCYMQQQIKAVTDLGQLLVCFVNHTGNKLLAEFMSDEAICSSSSIFRSS